VARFITAGPPVSGRSPPRQCCCPDSVPSRSLWSAPPFGLPRPGNNRQTASFPRPAYQCPLATPSWNWLGGGHGQFGSRQEICLRWHPGALLWGALTVYSVGKGALQNDFGFFPHPSDTLDSGFASKNTFPGVFWPYPFLYANLLSAAIHCDRAGNYSELSIKVFI